MTVAKSVIGAKREQEEVMTIRITVTTAVVMTGVIGNNAVKRAAVEKEDIIGHRRIVSGPKRGVGDVTETHHHLAKKIAAAAIVAATVAMIAAARRHHQDAILPNVAKSRHTKNHHHHRNQSLHQKNPVLTMCK